MFRVETLGKNRTWIQLDTQRKWEYAVDQCHMFSVELERYVRVVDERKDDKVVHEEVHHELIRERRA